MGTGTTGSISAEEDEGYGGKIHSAKSASLTISHTDDEFEAEGGRVA